MSNWNTIAELQRVAVKPRAWRLIQDAKDAFRLEFSHVLPTERNQWAHVQTARGETKVYKTVNAAMRDVARVQLQAVVFVEFTDGIFA